MLYRAFCFSTDRSFDTEAPISGPLSYGEATVFVEASSVNQATQRLRQGLSAAWGVPADSIDWYNLWNERYLAALHTSTGDAALFETGFGPDGVHYTRELPVMLVRPSTAARLYAVFCALPAGAGRSARNHTREEEKRGL